MRLLIFTSIFFSAFVVNSRCYAYTPKQPSYSYEDGCVVYFKVVGSCSILVGYTNGRFILYNSEKKACQDVLKVEEYFYKEKKVFASESGRYLVLVSIGTPKMTVYNLSNSDINLPLPIELPNATQMVGLGFDTSESCFFVYNNDKSTIYKIDIESLKISESVKIPNNQFVVLGDGKHVVGYTEHDYQIIDFCGKIIRKGKVGVDLRIMDVFYSAAQDEKLYIPLINEAAAALNLMVAPIHENGKQSEIINLGSYNNTLPIHVKLSSRNQLVLVQNGDSIKIFDKAGALIFAKQVPSNFWVRLSEFGNYVFFIKNQKIEEIRKNEFLFTKSINNEVVVENLFSTEFITFNLPNMCD